MTPSKPEMNSILFQIKDIPNGLRRIRKTRVVIGSLESADLRIADDTTVAPIHAVLEFEGEKAVLFDLGSDAGVFVNDKKIVTHEVSVGDRIRIGKTEIQFSFRELEAAESRALETEQAFFLLEEEASVEEIFDYRPASRTALEVVFSWQGMILDVEHYVREGQVHLGGSYLAKRKGKGYTLQLAPGMSGVLHRQGELVTLERLRGSNSETVQVPLEPGEFCKIRVGEREFYLRYTDAPPMLKRKRVLERDPFFIKLFLTSLALTGLMIAALLNMSVPKNIEAEQMPERIVKILYSPEQFKAKTTSVVDVQKATETLVEKTKIPKPPKPPEKVVLNLQNKPVEKKPIPKEMDVGHETKKSSQAAKSASKTPEKTPPRATQRAQKEAKEGEGAKAKGTEGKRGKPHAPQDPVAQNRGQMGKTAKSAQRGQSRIEGVGNVDALKGAEATIKNLLTGSTAQFGTGGQRLQGTGGFDTEGAEGLALSGSGSGGGGSAATLGLGGKGPGAGRVGTGLGAAGDGKGIIGGKSRVAVRGGGSEETIVMGSIDPDLVEAALMAHRDEFRLCYEREVNAGLPNLQGQVGTSFVIGSRGRVTSAGVSSSSLANANAERCILDVIRRIDFPMPRGAGIVQVNKSFRFRPTGGAR